MGSTQTRQQARVALPIFQTQQQLHTHLSPLTVFDFDHLIVFHSLNPKTQTQTHTHAHAKKTLGKTRSLVSF